MSPPNQPQEKITCYHVPRRFNLRAVIVLTTLLAMGCAFLQWLKTPSVVYMVLFGTIIIVSFGQLIFPKSPRLVSIVVTAGLCGIAAVGTALWNIEDYDFIAALFLFFVILVSLTVGALLGYLIGTLIAAVFMIADCISPNSMFPKSIPQRGAPPPASSDSPSV